MHPNLSILEPYEQRHVFRSHDCVVSPSPIFRQRYPTHIDIKVRQRRRRHGHRHRSLHSTSPTPVHVTNPNTTKDHLDAGLRPRRLRLRDSRPSPPIRIHRLQIHRPQLG